MKIVSEQVINGERIATQVIDTILSSTETQSCYIIRYIWDIFK